MNAFDPGPGDERCCCGSAYLVGGRRWVDPGTGTLHRAGYPCFQVAVGYVDVERDPLWMRLVARLSTADWWAIGTAAVVGVVGGVLVGAWWR